MKFDLPYQIALLLIYIVLAGVKGINNFPRGTWEDGLVHCNRAGSNLASDRDNSDIKKVLNITKTINIWLGIQSRRFITWTWLDGHSAAPSFTKQPWHTEMECGVFHLRDRAIEAGVCSINSYGFLCEGQESTACPTVRQSGMECIEVDNKDYTIGCEANNWYDARYKCNAMGMDLAVTKTENTLIRLHEALYGEGRRCTRLWIGLRKTDWMYTGDQFRGEIPQSAWAPREPTSDLSCAVVSNRLGPGTHLWFAERCDAVHSWICSKTYIRDKMEGSTHTSYTLNDRITNPHENLSLNPRDFQGTSTKGNINITIVGTVVAACVLIVFILAALIAWRTYQKRDRMEGAPEELSPINKTNPDEKDDPSSRMGSDNSSEVDHYGIFTFTHDGGYYNIPDSEIEIVIPTGVINQNLMCMGRLDIDADIGKRQNMRKDEKIVSPFMTFEVAVPLLQHVSIYIPHNIPKSFVDALRQVRAYERVGDCGNWEIVTTSSQDQDVYTTVEENMFVLHTKRNTEFVYTTDNKHLGEAMYSGLIIARYNELQQGKHEVAFHVCILDTLYARNEYTATLLQGAYSLNTLDYFSLRPSALPTYDMLHKVQVKVELRVNSSWKLETLREEEDPHVQVNTLKQSLPSEEFPVGREIAHFIVQKESMTERDSSLRYTVLLHLFENDNNCKTKDNAMKIWGEHSKVLTLDAVDE